MGLFYSAGEFFNYIRKTIVFFILAVLDSAFVGSYIYFSKGLVKPAGPKEALDFLITNPNDYGISLLTGILAYMLIYPLVIAALINIVKFIIRDSTDSLVVIIIEVILIIALIVVSILYLKGVGSLALVALLAVGVLWLWASSK